MFTSSGSTKISLISLYCTPIENLEPHITYQDNIVIYVEERHYLKNRQVLGLFECEVAE